MIKYKTQKEIEIIAEGGQILGKILKQTAGKVKPGVGTKELNDYAENLIKEHGGRPSFKGFKIDGLAFPSALCTSINDELVHGPAEPDRILKEGDIIGLDIGMEYKGFFTDTAVTVGAGQISQQAQKLLEVTKTCLDKSIEVFKPGNSLFDVAKVIQEYAEKNGFGVVKQLVGHGVGYAVHEDPKVPNYKTEESKSIIIKPGLVVAFEPMLTVGGWRLQVLDNDFTFATEDGSLSAQFEHTIALDHNNKTRIITLA